MPYWSLRQVSMQRRNGCSTSPAGRAGVKIGLVRCNPLWHHSRAAIDGKMLEKFATLRITGQIPQSAGSLGGGLLHFCGGRRPSTSAELLITLPRGTGCGADSAGGGRLLGLAKRRQMAVELGVTSAQRCGSIKRLPLANDCLARYGS